MQADPENMTQRYYSWERSFLILRRRSRLSVSFTDTRMNCYSFSGKVLFLLIQEWSWTHTHTHRAVCVCATACVCVNLVCRVGVWLCCLKLPNFAALHPLSHDPLTRVHQPAWLGVSSSTHRLCGGVTACMLRPAGCLSGLMTVGVMTS